ncbi:hypothetical protein [Roseateles sp.]|uniref:hypothetical protein n=1 Tax=Roseateles sp. TaxID=1971397 RepID=UPI0032652568
MPELQAQTTASASARTEARPAAWYAAEFYTDLAHRPAAARRRSGWPTARRE